MVTMASGWSLFVLNSAYQSASQISPRQCTAGNIGAEAANALVDPAVTMNINIMRQSWLITHYDISPAILIIVANHSNDITHYDI